MNKDYVWNKLKECKTVEEVLSLKEEYCKTVKKDLARIEEIDEEVEKLYEERRVLKDNAFMAIYEDHFYVKLGQLYEEILNDNS